MALANRLLRGENMSGTLRCKICKCDLFSLYGMTIICSKCRTYVADVKLFDDGGEYLEVRK